MSEVGIGIIIRNLLVRAVDIVAIIRHKHVRSVTLATLCDVRTFAEKMDFIRNVACVFLHEKYKLESL